MTSQVLQVRTCTQGVTTELLTSDPLFGNGLQLPVCFLRSSAPPQALEEPVYPVEAVEHRRKEICRADVLTWTSLSWKCYLVGR